MVREKKKKSIEERLTATLLAKDVCIVRMGMTNAGNLKLLMLNLK